MRIAVWHNLPSGGGKRALYDQVEGLIGRGHAVESWCPPTADQTFLPLGLLGVEHVIPLPRCRRTRLQAVTDRAVGQTSDTFTGLMAMDEHCRACAEQIDRGNFDVVLAGSCTAFAVTSLAKYLKTPKVLYLQEPFRPLYEAMPELPWPAMKASPGWQLSNIRRRAFDVAQIRAFRVRARAELEGVQAYDRVLANSLFSRESILRAYGVDSEVCYLGVDTVRYRDLGRARRNLVLGLGAFVPQKRVDVVIRSIAQIPIDGLELAWIGNVAEPSYFEGLLRLAQQLGVAFRPLVSVPHEDVVGLLNEASVMAYAPRLEPFGLAPLEAAACGLPVVARSEGGIRETVIHGETGILVDADAQLPSAIARILRDKELAERLGQCGRRRVEAFWSLSAATDRIEFHLAQVAQAGEGFS